METNRIKNGLSEDDTLCLKGIALLLLLFHHLFYDCDTSYYNALMVGGVNLTRELANASRICVAIFVFLSGYGLAKSKKRKHVTWKSFFLRRYLKLYFGYWTIYFLFVPIGILFFERSISSVYAPHEILYSCIDLLGMAYNFGTPTYNATWWFYSCITILYFCFPIILKYARDLKGTLVLCVVGLIIMHFIKSVSWYIIVFVAGVYLSKDHVFYNLAKRIEKISLYHNWIQFPVMLVGLIILLCIRNYSVFFNSVKVDWIIVIYIVLMYKIWGNANKYFIFLGKHSMNIFLFHTFIFGYYMKEITYFPYYPLLITIWLLLLCLVISVFVEKVKTVIGINRILNII